MKFLRNKYCRWFMDFWEGIKIGLQTYAVIQIALLLPALVLAKLFGYAAGIVLLFALLFFIYFKFSKILWHVTPEGLTRYKMDYAFLFTRSKAFFSVMSVLSVVCLACAVYSTWFYSHVGLDKIKETCVLMKDIPWQVLYVAPTYLSTPCSVLSDVYNAVLVKDMEAITNLSNSASDILTGMEMHFYVSYGLWLLYGIINLPGRIYSKGVRMSKEVTANGDIDVQV